MASQRALRPLKRMLSSLQIQQEPIRAGARSMATESSLPTSTLSQSYTDAHLSSAAPSIISEARPSESSSTLTTRAIPELPPRFQPQKNPFLTTAECTLYAFPAMEPVRLTSYPSTHLLLPLRRDILHKATIFEGDNMRAGTASTKWRDDVRGSGRKIRPQKGTGRARLGDKKSPMLRGGGVAHGPKPRDFGTELPRKIYDLAWRTALSYRYKQGDLILADGPLEISGVGENSLERFTKDLLRWNSLGRSDGKTLFVAQQRRDNLFSALEETAPEDSEAFALSTEVLRVRDLLRVGRVVIEKSALDWIFAEHEEDLGPAQRLFPSQ